MKMKNITMAVIIASMAGSAQAFDAKTMAQGGAGVAAGDYTQHLLNPAHLATFDADDDIGASVGLGVLLQDKDDLVDSADATADALNALEDESGDYPAKVKLAVDSVKSLANKHLSAEAGGSLYVAVPNSIMPASVFVDSSAKMAAGIGDIHPDDLRGIENSSVIATLDTDALKTELESSAVMTVDVGVALAKTVETPLPGTLNVGGAVKYQGVTLIDYSERLASFDGDKLLDSRSEDWNFNIDLGVSYQYNDMLSVGLTGKNLFSKTYTSKTTSEEYKVEPEFTAGVGVKYGIFSAVADVKLSATGGYGVIQETQYASLGVTADFWEHARLSAGFRSDLEDNDVDVMTLGVGFSPWDVFGVNATVMVGEDDAFGGAIQAVAKF